MKPEEEMPVIAKTRSWTVFIASPSDMGKERLFVRGWFESVNEKTRRRWNTDFVVKGWDSHCDADLGDAQTIIDRKAGLDDENLALVVVLFRERFGTPTNEAQSGTEHEYQLAKARRRRNETLNRIWFPDNDVTLPFGEPISKKVTDSAQPAYSTNSWPTIKLFFQQVAQPKDVAQYDKVRHFRDRVASEALYVDVASDDDLCTRIGEDLDRWLRSSPWLWRIDDVREELYSEMRKARLPVCCLRAWLSNKLRRSLETKGIAYDHQEEDVIVAFNSFGTLVDLSRNLSVVRLRELGRVVSWRVKLRAWLGAADTIQRTLLGITVIIAALVCSIDWFGWRSTSFAPSSTKVNPVLAIGALVAALAWLTGGFVWWHLRKPASVLMRLSSSNRLAGARVALMEGAFFGILLAILLLLRQGCIRPATTVEKIWIVGVAGLSGYVVEAWRTAGVCAPPRRETFAIGAAILLGLAVSLAFYAGQFEVRVMSVVALVHLIGCLIASRPHLVGLSSDIPRKGRSGLAWLGISIVAASGIGAALQATKDDVRAIGDRGKPIAAIALNSLTYAPNADNPHEMSITRAVDVAQDDIEGTINVLITGALVHTRVADGLADAKWEWSGSKMEKGFGERIPLEGRALTIEADYGDASPVRFNCANATVHQSFKQNKYLVQIPARNGTSRLKHLRFHTPLSDDDSYRGTLRIQLFESTNHEIIDSQGKIGPTEDTFVDDDGHRKRKFVGDNGERVTWFEYYQNDRYDQTPPSRSRREILGFRLRTNDAATGMLIGPFWGDFLFPVGRFTDACADFPHTTSSVLDVAQGKPRIIRLVVSGIFTFSGACPGAYNCPEGGIGCKQHSGGGGGLQDAFWRMDHMAFASLGETTYRTDRWFTRFNRIELTANDKELVQFAGPDEIGRVPQPFHQYEVKMKVEANARIRFYVQDGGQDVVPSTFMTWDNAGALVVEAFESAD